MENASSASTGRKEVMITDDDEFEEFKAQDISFNNRANAELEGEQAWVEDWQDGQEESEFVKEVNRILAEGGYEQKQ